MSDLLGGDDKKKKRKMRKERKEKKDRQDAKEAKTESQAKQQQVEAKKTVKETQRLASEQNAILQSQVSDARKAHVESKSLLEKQLQQQEESSKRRRIPLDRDASILAAGRRQRMAMMRRRGRMSTLLTDELQGSTGTGFARSLGG